jgi:predicted nucleic-acid-binding protein
VPKLKGDFVVCLLKHNRKLAREAIACMVEHYMVEDMNHIERARMTRYVTSRASMTIKDPLTFDEQSW